MQTTARFARYAWAVLIYNLAVIVWGRAAPPAGADAATMAALPGPDHAARACH
jgi:hypothetical protein